MTSKQQKGFKKDFCKQELFHSWNLITCDNAYLWREIGALTKKTQKNINYYNVGNNNRTNKRERTASKQWKIWVNMGADLRLIWPWSPLLSTRKLAPKKTFSCEKQTCTCRKKTLIYIKVSLKGLKEFHFKLFLAITLASGATRPRLGVSEYTPNPQFQGLKIDLCGYCRPNYFSRSAPGTWSWSSWPKLHDENKFRVCKARIG